MLGEVRVYLRHRRAAWKPIAFSVSVATISVSLWVVFIARLG